MAKIGIYDDERFPFFELTQTQDLGLYSSNGEVDDETLERWRRVMAEFEQVQFEMDQYSRQWRVAKQRALTTPAFSDLVVSYFQENADKPAK